MLPEYCNIYDPSVSHSPLHREQRDANNSKLMLVEFFICSVTLYRHRQLVFHLFVSVLDNCHGTNLIGLFLCSMQIIEVGSKARSITHYMYRLGTQCVCTVFFEPSVKGIG